MLGHRYGRFGFPRAADPALFARIGEHHGVSVFIELGQDISEVPENLFVLTPDCKFLLYKTPEGMR